MLASEGKVRASEEPARPVELCALGRAASIFRIERFVAIKALPIVWLCGACEQPDSLADATRSRDTAELVHNVTEEELP